MAVSVQRSQKTGAALLPAEGSEELPSFSFSLPSRPKIFCSRAPGGAVLVYRGRKGPAEEQLVCEGRGHGPWEVPEGRAERVLLVGFLLLFLFFACQGRA